MTPQQLEAPLSAGCLSAPRDLSRDLLDHGKWDLRLSERRAAPVSTQSLRQHFSRSLAGQFFDE